MSCVAESTISAPHLADAFQINGLVFGENRAADEQAEDEDAVFHVCFLV